jgi:lipopolysaccharide/colanic/teichoic acid biosynthesis glycosyltransferase
MSMVISTESSPQERTLNASLVPAMPRIVSAAAPWYGAVKSGLDFTLALLLLLGTAPLIALSILLVKLTSRGPGIYSQTRLGRYGRPFTLYKIRTMTHNCESLTGVQWSKPGDSRVTGLGRWLRRTHLDELPQLWNVLRGDMSLIGPRPERPEFVPQLEQALPLYRQRLNVRPGVTGLAQVQLPPDTDLESVRIKLAYDLQYIKHVDLSYDLRIYWATFCKMLGLPFPVIQCLFRFPARESIENEYLALSSPYRKVCDRVLRPEAASAKAAHDLAPHS